MKQSNQLDLLKNLSTEIYNTVPNKVYNHIHKRVSSDVLITFDNVYDLLLIEFGEDQ